MPRGGAPLYTYTLPPVYLAVPGTTILATQHNTPLEDIEDTFNTEWPGYLVQWIVPTADVLELPDGAVGAPSLTFTNDTDSGIYRIGANNIGVSVNGAKVLDVGTTGLGVVGKILNGDGTVSLPAFSYTSDPDSGWYRIGANNIGAAVNGAKVLDVSTTGLGVTGTTLSGDGTVSLPGFAFTGDTDTGMYRIGANNIGVAVNGAKVLDVATTGLGVTGTASSTGSNTATSFIPTGSTVPTNGMYLPSANTLGWAINSAAEVQLTATALSPVANDGNAVGTSSLRWSDVFLAQGAVINFKTGISDSTITEVSNSLYLAGNGITSLIVGGLADGTASATIVGLPQGRLSFPATQNPSADPNVLDDYEEGTFTCSFSAGTGTITSISGSGAYVKIGKGLILNLAVTDTNNGTGGAYIVVNGFPFAFSGDQSLMGMEITGGSGATISVQLNNGSTTGTMKKYDGTYPLATGQAFRASGACILAN